MSRRKAAWCKGSVILVAFSMAAATPFLATAGGRARVMEAVGLGGVPGGESGQSSKVDHATANDAGASSADRMVGQGRQTVRERPLQFNFRRY